MCGRFTQTNSSSEIAKAFNLTNVPELKPRYNIAPTQQVGTILHSNSPSEREFKWLRWGLIPHWAKDKSIGNKLINARAETIAQKPSFRSAFRHSRCLIIASGFYEWQRAENHKQPFYIQQIDSLPLAFAGLWSTARLDMLSSREHPLCEAVSFRTRSTWQSPENETINTCTIITTEANEIMKPIHQRMPVILKSDNYEKWLDPTIQKPELLQPLLQPDSSAQLKIYPVSTLVNNSRNNNPKCISSIED